eukprot:Gb_29956 [translate_table: standard]
MAFQEILQCMSAQGIVVAAAVVILVSVFSIKFDLLGHRIGGYRLPPGPTPLPIIGNLHKLGKLPHKSLQALAKKHGPLMYLRLGSVSTVVASSPEMAKTFLKTHDAIFASRPPTSAGKHTAYDGKDMAFAPYGAYWRHIRKLCTLQLLTAKRLQSFQNVREEEVGLMVDSIGKESAYPLNQSQQDPHIPHNKYYVQNLSAELFNIGDFIPWLQRFDLQGILKEGGEDFVDVLLDMKLRRESIKALILDMLLAGVDTSATTLEWALSELLRNPHIMKKAQQELETVVGKSRRVKESDLLYLEYLHCVVKETLRMYPAGPLMISHESMEGCTVGGYHIPAKTRLIVNMWAIGRDPDMWEDPLAFRPERFMEREIDVRGQNFEMIPFGSGRRGCPGSLLAIGVVELALAQLLHCFEWSVEGDPADLDTSEAFGLSIPRQHPLYAFSV